MAINRSVHVKESGKAGEELIDIKPKGFSVRTVAQEYGDGAVQISGDPIIFYNYKDQRLYKQSILSGRHGALLGFFMFECLYASIGGREIIEMKEDIESSSLGTQLEHYEIRFMNIFSLVLTPRFMF